MNLRRLSAGLLTLVTVLATSGCGQLKLWAQDGVEAAYYDLEWLDDGWIYYQFQASSDAPVELWRRRPDGSDRARFAPPAPAECPSTGLVFLFVGPGGGIGAGVSCPKQDPTELIEYPASGGTPTHLAEVDDVYGATWSRGGGAGYLQRQAETCSDIVPVPEGRTMTVTVQGKSWPVTGCPAGAGAVRQPMLTRDGGTLFFLAATDQPWDNPAHTFDPDLRWQLMRSDRGGSPRPVGEPLAGASDLVVSPDGTQAVIALDDRLIAQPTAGGPAREIGRVDAFDLAFAPDGRSVMVTTIRSTFERFDVG